MSIVLSNISSFFYQHRYVQCRCRSNIESCQLLQYQKSKAGNSSHHLKRIEEFLLSYVKFTYIQTGTFDSKSACCLSNSTFFFISIVQLYGLIKCIFLITHFFLSASYSPTFSGIHLRVCVTIKPLFHFSL